MQEKVAVVTGAGRGIGRAIALRLAREGYALALCARTLEQVQETAELCRREGARAEAWRVDVSSWEEVSRWAEEVVGKFGRVDVLINNAGIFLDKPLLETEPEEWRRVIEVNLHGQFYCVRAFAPHMVRAGGGQIINIASTSGKKPYVRQGAYCASKYGVLGMTKVLALELREAGVRVAAICPGGVDTELVRGRLDRPDWLQPEDIAEVVVFLLGLPERAAVDEVIIRRFTADPY